MDKVTSSLKNCNPDDSLYVPKLMHVPIAEITSWNMYLDILVQFISHRLWLQERGTELLQLSFRGEYREQISCSHAAPKDGTVQFMKPLEERICYPGWQGSISIMLTQPPVGVPSHIFFDTGMYTGPGGPSHKSEALAQNLPPIYGQIYKWGVTVFESDIPGLDTEHKEYKLACLIQGVEPNPAPSVKYQYHNAETIRRVTNEPTFKKRMSASP